MRDLTRVFSELQLNETLEWTGQPNPWRVFSVADVLLIPFSLLWGGGIIFVSTSVIVGDASVFSTLWGIPFVLVGLQVIVGRYLVNAWDKRHTWYGLTNRRVIIMTTAFGHRVQSLYLNVLPQVELQTTASGQGTLLFGPSPAYESQSDLRRFWLFSLLGLRRQLRAPGFYDVPDVRAVFELVTRLRGTSA